jgi:hypothetical protein
VTLVAASTALTAFLRRRGGIRRRVLARTQRQYLVAAIGVACRRSRQIAWAVWRPALVASWR